MMTLTARHAILRANALFLLVASAGGMVTDIGGSFFARGPEAVLLGDTPGAGIGFIEAHGLAFIIGVLLWRAEPSRAWHLTAAAVHVLLGTANLLFWQFFVLADVLAVGYATTALHWTFVLLQLMAAVGHAGLQKGTGATSPVPISSPGAAHSTRGGRAL
jgi:hypothetical protein